MSARPWAKVVGLEISGELVLIVLGVGGLIRQWKRR